MKFPHWLSTHKNNLLGTSHIWNEFGFRNISGIFWKNSEIFGILYKIWNFLGDFFGKAYWNLEYFQNISRNIPQNIFQVQMCEVPDASKFQNLNSRWDKKWKHLKKNQNLLLKSGLLILKIQFSTVCRFKIWTQGGTKTENISKRIKICY